jgi:hypothetical protein
MGLGPVGGPRPSPQFLTLTSPEFDSFLFVYGTAYDTVSAILTPAIGHLELSDWARRYYLRNPSRSTILRYRSASLFLRYVRCLRR